MTITVEQVDEAEIIVARHIDAWGWGPLDEIEGLSEHVLAVNACRAGYTEATRQAEEQIKLLREELKLWRMLVNEGGVPRYTVTPGAALNTIVTSTDAILRKTEATNG